MAGFKDPVYRSRFLHWMWQPLAIFCLGIMVSLKGPTLPDLQIITGTDTQVASFFFIIGAFGYLVGSFIAGAIYGKMNNNLLMSSLLIFGGCAVIWTPYCSAIPLMLFNQFLSMIFGGGMDTTVNAEHMRIWGSQGQALLQFTHFAFAFGGIVSPLFAEPFLAEKALKIHHNETWSSLVSIVDITQSPNMTSVTDDGLIDFAGLNYTDAEQTSQPRISNVHPAFLIGGLIPVLSSIPFIVMFFIDKRQKRPEKEKYGQELPQRKLPNYLHILLVSFLGAFYLAYCATEMGFSFFLMTFVTSEYEEVSTTDGAYITTFYWASFAVGRFCSIFVSKWTAAARQLYAHLFLMVSAYCGFLVSAQYGNIAALKGFTCLAGISMSAVFPAGFSWTENEILMVTGRISAIFIINASAAGIITFFLMGFLMQNLSNMWFCYLLFASTILLVVVFLILLLLNRFYIDKKYGTVKRGKDIEIEVDSPMTSGL